MRFDVRVQGQLSGVERQLDVLIEENHSGRTVRTAVEAKQYSRKIHVKHVEGFIGVLRDVGLERGMMLSSSGYTKAAAQRVFADDVDVDLDIFSLAEFVGWQNKGGIPFAGRNGAIVDAPLGWILDPTPMPGVLAALYRRGVTLDVAVRESEFMYLNIWDRSEMPDLERLLAHQERNLREWDPETHIATESCDVRSDYRTRLRRAETIYAPTAEITGFVEFPNFIFFAVLFSPLVHERRNVRKLEHVLRSAIPLQMTHAVPQLDGMP